MDKAQGWLPTRVSFAKTPFRIEKVLFREIGKRIFSDEVERQMLDKGIAQLRETKLPLCSDLAISAGIENATFLDKIFCSFWLTSHSVVCGTKVRLFFFFF